MAIRANVSHPLESSTASVAHSIAKDDSQGAMQVFVPEISS